MGIFARQHTATQRDLEEMFEKKIGEVSKEEILSIIPKNQWEDEETYSDFKFTKSSSRWDKKKTWWNRLNCLWIIPIYVVFIGPLLWITTGNFGLHSTSKLGSWIERMIGEDSGN